MVDSNKLVGAIYSKGYKKCSFAKALGKNASWFSERLKKKNFTIAEACNISKILDLSSDEVNEIFFA